MTSTFPKSSARARLRHVSLEAVRDLPAWREGLQHLVKDHRYYEIVADTLGFHCRAVVIEDGAGEVLAVQPCFFVEQDLVIAAPRLVRAVAGAIRRVVPRFLRPKVLMVGCAAGEGHLTAPPEAVAQIHDALRDFAREAGARLIVWKDVPARYRDALHPLKKPPADCAHVPSMPAARLSLDFASFDDYLARGLS